MPGTAPIGVSQLLTAPPLALLAPVLDEDGPFAFGSHTITNFRTTVSHGVLGPGTYGIGGTYGLIVQPTVFPITWGYDLGYDSGGAIGDEGFIYENRFAQVIVMHQMLGGAYLSVQSVDCHLVQNYIPLEFIPLGGDRIGLYVEPAITVDLYFLCLLA